MNNRVAVWKQGRRPRGSARGFFRKHERLLTFVGAIIVFATFVMREAVREYLKQKSDEMQAAQFAYSNIEHMTGSMYLAGVPADILQKLSDIEEDDYEDEDMTKVDDIIDVRPSLAKGLLIMHLDVPAAEALAEGLPDAKTKLEELEKLSDKLDKMNRVFDDIPRLSKVAFRRKSKREQVEKKEELGDQFDAYSDGMQKLQKEWVQFASAMLSEAINERDEAKSWYDRSTIGGYILYALGWGLGLVGKIYGLGGGGSE